MSGNSTSSSSNSDGGSDGGTFQIVIIIASLIISMALIFAIYIFYIRDLFIQWAAARNGNLPDDAKDFMTNYKSRDRNKSILINVSPGGQLTSNTGPNSPKLNGVVGGLKRQFSKNDVENPAEGQYEMVGNPILLGSPDDDSSDLTTNIPLSPTGLALDDDDVSHEVSIDTNREILKSGYLMKKSSGYSKSWLMRWFFIVDGKLYYCRHHTDQSYGLVKATLVANLMISKVKAIGSLGFEITSPGDRGSGIGGGVYELQSASDSAEGRSDIDDWIQCIRDEGEAEQEYLSNSDIANQLLHSGYLKKKSSGVKQVWLSRWFFVVNGILYYTHRPSDLSEGLVMATQVANLVISTVKEVSRLEFQIISPGQRGRGGGVFHLQGSNEADVALWVAKVRSQIEGSLNRNLAAEPSSTSASLLFVPNQSLIKAVKQANPYCADCGSPNPDWASWNLCIMLCIECSGIHRSMGSHISKVRSLTLDKWSLSSINLLTDHIGNDRSNELWEGSLESSGRSDEKPTLSSNRKEKETFIINKYVKKQYLSSDLKIYTSDDLIKLVKSGIEGGRIIDILKALVAGFDVNTELESGTGLTALHLAVEQSLSDCVEFLCQFNADANKSSAASGSALDVAKLQASSPSKSANATNKLIIDCLVHHLTTTSQ